MSGSGFSFPRESQHKDIVITRTAVVFDPYTMISLPELHSRPSVHTSLRLESNRLALLFITAETPKQLLVNCNKMSDILEEITKHMELLALQHNKGSEDCSSDQKAETDVEQLLTEFKNKVNITQPTKDEDTRDSDSDCSDDLDVDPSHTYSDLNSFALQLTNATCSTHLLAVNMRNWFAARSLPEHHQVMKQISQALCLRRLNAVVVEFHAMNPSYLENPEADIVEGKKRLRRLLGAADDGLSSLGVVEMDLIEVFSICQAGEELASDGWDNSAYADILEELVRIQKGSHGEKQEWMQGWTILPGIG